jgi:hypothetical protein
MCDNRRRMHEQFADPWRNAREFGHQFRLCACCVPAGVGPSGAKDGHEIEELAAPQLVADEMMIRPDPDLHVIGEQVFGYLGDRKHSAIGDVARSERRRLAEHLTSDARANAVRPDQGGPLNGRTAVQEDGDTVPRPARMM